MGKEIGIDLGTTNTVVSYVNKKNKLKVLKNSGKMITPSAIFYKSEDEWIVGYSAVEMMKVNPIAGVINFKSIIESSDKIKIVAENGDILKLRPKETASHFLNSIIKNVENKLIKEFGIDDGVLESAVITVPAKFSSTKKEATKYCAKVAGLKDVKLLAEPTAAAIGYQRELGSSGKTILVYDFGGGTFDVSVLTENNGVFSEIATGGDDKLGGNNLNDRIIKLIQHVLFEDYDLDMPAIDDEVDEDDFEDDYKISFGSYIKNKQAIYNASNELKEELSSLDKIDLTMDIILSDESPLLFDFTLGKEEFNNLIKPDIEKTVKITRNIINEVFDQDIVIDEIILAGGSSQIPLVKELLEKSIDLPIVFADDVSTIISRGASISANENYGDGLVKAITNVELGIEVSQGTRFKLFEPLIFVNQNLPYTVEKEYSLKEDNQERLKIKIFERDIKNYPNATRVFDDGVDEIDELLISNLPSNLSKDKFSIKIIFDAKIDGSLNVSAKIIDLSTNQMILDNEVKVNKASNLE
ncbi:MAG: Hsp70 family protein [Peptostreptococcaceae bacterium]